MEEESVELVLQAKGRPISLAPVAGKCRNGWKGRSIRLLFIARYSSLLPLIAKPTNFTRPMFAPD